MLFWTTIIVMILGLILSKILFEHYFEISYFISGVISGLAACALLIEIVVLSVNYIGVDGYIQRMNVRHDMLVYEYENDIYDNDNDLGKRELIEDIQDWNEDLALRKQNQNDAWIGIFIPDIYDQFEFIELGDRSELLAIYSERRK